VFHLDSGGKVVAGEPGGAKKAKPAKAKKESDSDPIGDMLESWKKVPFAVKALLAIVVIGALVYNFMPRGSNSGVKLGLPPGVTPESLEGRTIIAAEAFVSAEFNGKLKGMAAAGTEADLLAWYKKVRPFVGDYKKQEPGYDVTVMAAGVQEPGKTEGATSSTKAIMDFPQKPDQDKKETGFTLDLDWKFEAGEWKLDGKAMLARAPSSRQ
jgi:hypothetical protein